MQKPVVNLKDVSFSREIRHGDKFEAKVAPIGLGLGARKLGYNVTAVAPGKRAFPFHNHHVNEEMFLILQGTGTLRVGQQEFPVTQGDIVSCPSGGPELVHQIINTGTQELRYLAVSTMIETDVFEYPDSGKFGVAANRAPGMRVLDAPFGGFFKSSGRIDYYDGE